MNSVIRRKVVRFFVVAMLVSPATLFAAFVATGSFEETIDVNGVAVLDVTNERGAIEVIGADVDTVLIQATITINERLSASNPMRAEKIIRSVKRSPPVSVEGGRVEIGKLSSRHQRHASISYKIVVPRDSEVKVHSVSGNVKVDGVTGIVKATSDKGEVTLADSPAPKNVDSTVSAAVR